MLRRQPADLVPELGKKYGRFVELFSEEFIHIGKNRQPRVLQLPVAF
jgi:hypothetical protein